MALIVEDGTIVAGAESLATVAEADTYWSNRGDAAWAALATAAKEEALREGTAKLLNGRQWRGMILNNDQPLSWPRWEVTDLDGRSYDSDEIPIDLKNAAIEYAKLASVASLRTTSTSRKTTKAKLGPLETEFTAFGTAEVMAPWIDRMISKFLVGGGGSSRFIKG
jgi:hypothetical protein